MRVLVLAGLVVSLVAGGGASAGDQVLYGTVGPDFTMLLADASGQRVNHLDPGTYTIRVEDKSAGHNFHLIGPGVDVATGVLDEGTFIWSVTLRDGIYTYICDPHSGEMSGAFAVGNATLPPLLQPSALGLAMRLNGKVAPGWIAFERTALAGHYVITIYDTSAADDFHLKGPGLDRKTSVHRKQTVIWNVTLVPGTYTFRSDSHATLRGTLKVSAS